MARKLRGVVCFSRRRPGWGAGEDEEGGGEEGDGSLSGDSDDGDHGNVMALSGDEWILLSMKLRPWGSRGLAGNAPT